MNRSQIRPLKTFALEGRPLPSHAVSWSCDAELAVATEDSVHIYLPEYPPPASGSFEETKPKDTALYQFSLSLHVTGVFSPLMAVNAQLCAQAGVRLPPPEGRPAPDERTATLHPITGLGGSVSQIVRVEWSPSGVGANLRPVLTAMTSNGRLVTLGEHHDTQPMVSSGYRSRSIKTWKVLWALGGGMPIPAEDHEGAYRTMDERAVSFSWAKEILPGRALLAYLTDEDEVVVMGIQYFTRQRSATSSPNDFVWQIRELARFEASRPHKTCEPMDPDYLPNGSSFSLKWSPWARSGGLTTGMLAIISNNHVGFRRVVINGDWEQGQDPNLEVAESDSTGICLSLSTDAFLEWEDAVWEQGGPMMARGIICSPFEISPFEIDLLGSPNPPILEHSTADCSTKYPEHSSKNPITGLIIYHSKWGVKPPLPLYSAVRASATALNEDWFQTNLPPSSTSIPSWATRISRTVQRVVARDEAIDAPDEDSDSEGSEGEFEEGVGRSNIKLHPYRFRIWGFASSPGGGSSMALVTKYNTQLHSRKGFCKLLFGIHPPEQRNQDGEALDRSLTTEGQMWEWMYGNGGPVYGATDASDGMAMEVDQSMATYFEPARDKQMCAFCKGKLQNDGAEAKCDNGHSFATCSVSGLAILAPGVSRICAVCQRRRLREEEVLKLATECFGPDATPPSPGDLCGGCGGKFVA